MKLLCVGDLHLTDKCPANRMDDYKKSVLFKFEWILKTAGLNGCEVILQPGDFTDYPTLPYEFFIEIARLIDYHQIKIITVPGQHDLYHRNYNNTFLRALSGSCNYLHVLEDNQYFSLGNICVYGAGWEKDIPEEIDEKKYNVLLTHRMVINEKLWGGQESFNYACSLLRSYKYNLIVSGDNHQTFITKVGRKSLLNLGSIMRSTIAQIEHKPKVVVLEVENSRSEEIYIPVEPPEKVFRMDRIQRNKERDEKLEAFISGLSEYKEMKLSFSDNLNAYLKKNNIDQEVVNILKGCLNEGNP